MKEVGGWGCEEGGEGDVSMGAHVDCSLEYSLY